MTGCGVDIIEIARIEKAVLKNDGFMTRVFSEKEIEYFNHTGCRMETLAGFFAAKEAFSKYLGTGISGFALKDISVEHTSKGMPYIIFNGKKSNVSLTISHNKTMAVAVVCGESSVYDVKNPLREEMSRLLPKRSLNSNKGDFGKILVVAGSKGMTGAAVLSAYSALRAGTGLVTLAVPASQRAIAAGFYPEIMTTELAEKDGVISQNAMGEVLRLAKGKDVVVFGPGMGQSRDITLVLSELLQSYTGKLLIDADGLNALSKNVEMLNEKSCQVVITPHPGEMSRLTGFEISHIQENRETVAKDFADRFDTTVVLKGFGTVVAKAGRDTFTNPTGNPGLATAGTGDVLSGVVAALWGQGVDAFDAARLGVYLHGLAGDFAMEELSDYGMLASDVARLIPKAILSLQK